MRQVQSLVKDEPENVVLKLELVPEHSAHQNITEDDDIHDDEEKESSEEGQSGSMPLAVPMMASTVHSSVTRNDAKMITETRLKRLRLLSQRSDEALSKGQKDEKKRIIRLEKNRRAAAMSRRKKKMYVKNLEENSKLMARHIAILEMENAHLKAFMSVSQHTPGQPMRAGPLPMHHMYQMPQFTGSNMQQFNMGSTASANGCSASLVHSAPSANLQEPPTKRRKMNDTTSTSVSDQYSEIESLTEDNSKSIEPIPLEPLPVPIPVGAPPAIPRMMPMMPPHLMPPSMGGIHPSQMMTYAMPHSLAPHVMDSNAIFRASAPTNVPSQALLPEIGKLEGIVADKDSEISDSNKDVKYRRDSAEECERKSVELDDDFSGYLDDMAPDILVSDNELCDLSILVDPQDITVIAETVDECGSVIGSQPEGKRGNMVYL